MEESHVKEILSRQKSVKEIAIIDHLVILLHPLLHLHQVRATREEMVEVIQATLVLCTLSSLEEKVKQKTTLNVLVNFLPFICVIC